MMDETGTSTRRHVICRCLALRPVELCELTGLPIDMVPFHDSGSDELI